MRRTGVASWAGARGRAAAHGASRESLHWACGLRMHASEQAVRDANSGSPSDELWDCKHVTPQPRSPHLSMGGDKLKWCPLEDQMKYRKNVLSTTLGPR